MQRLLLIILLINSFNIKAETPLIAVASNMIDVMSEITRAYENETGGKVKLNFGSSGNFTTQIIQGAPYHLFIPASKHYVDKLFDMQIIDHHGSRFTQGPIGVFIPIDSKLVDMSDLDSIFNALKSGRFRKIAIANPEHAPYGVAAIQALQHAGVWAIESNRILLAENVAQVIHYGNSGSVDLTIIPYSFMKTKNMQNRGKFYLIPKSWYDPIVQYVVILANATQETRNFIDFLNGNKATGIINDYGYSLPGAE